MLDKEMTIEAAIIELNRLKVNGYMPVDVARRDRALEKAKAALSKQIPKKPNPEREYCYGNGQCPNCNAVFLDKLTNFCGNCGQALDWSD